jgi:tRNA A37 threonylcarbamoyladenosine synthetase subunit TsaC/SUA5/YrdC
MAPNQTTTLTVISETAMELLRRLWPQAVSALLEAPKETPAAVMLRSWPDAWFYRRVSRATIGSSWPKPFRWLAHALAKRESVTMIVMRDASLAFVLEKKFPWWPL